MSREFNSEEKAKQLIQGFIRQYSSPSQLENHLESWQKLSKQKGLKDYLKAFPSDRFSSAANAKDINEMVKMFIATGSLYSAPGLSNLINAVVDEANLGLALRGDQGKAFSGIKPPRPW